MFNLFYRYAHISREELAPSNDAHPYLMPCNQLAMAAHFYQSGLGQLHERIDLFPRPLEVVDGKGIHSDGGETLQGEADFKHTLQCCEAAQMTLGHRGLPRRCVPPIAVHDKGDVRWDGP